MVVDSILLNTFEFNVTCELYEAKKCFIKFFCDATLSYQKKERKPEAFSYLDHNKKALLSQHEINMFVADQSLNL